MHIPRSRYSCSLASQHHVVTVRGDFRILESMDPQKFVDSIKLAKKQCGIEFDLKEKQLKCMETVARVQDCIGILPTGYGKSLIYSLLPALLDHYYEYSTTDSSIVVLVSPLQALMEEQVEKIRKLNISAAYLGASDLTQEQEEKVKNAEYSILIMSPESLFGGRWMSVFCSEKYRNRVKVLAVDEAHCFVEWGKEFRREYSRLGELRGIFTNATVLALTASAPPSMIPLLKTHLLLQKDTVQITESANRKNVCYIAKEAPKSIGETFHWLIQNLLLEKENCKKTIIYCRSIKAAGQLFSYFMSELGDAAYVGKRFSGNRIVGMYHRATVPRIKKMVTESFPKQDSTIRVVIATVAFGMGIDCPDVASVINWGAPSAFEDFYQQAGRAGRNQTMQSYSIVYYHKMDISPKSTDDRMREFCLGQETEKPADSSDVNSDSDVSAEDLLGTVTDAAPSQSTFVKKAAAVCRREIICKYLTPSETFTTVQPAHSCCDLCYTDCNCDNCPPLLGIDFSHVSDKVLETLSFEAIIRDVTQTQREAVRKKLNAMYDENAHISGLFKYDLITSLDRFTITQIVAALHHIHQADDLCAYLFDDEQMDIVMSAIDKVLESVK